MPGSTFQTNPIDLYKLLENCHAGILQLPDFQRSWVWDEDRIKSLIASVSRAFPVGALMSLDTGGPVNFKPRPVEGAPPEAKTMSLENAREIAEFQCAGAIVSKINIELATLPPSSG